MPVPLEALVFCLSHEEVTDTNLWKLVLVKHSILVMFGKMVDKFWLDEGIGKLWQTFWLGASSIKPFVTLFPLKSKLLSKCTVKSIWWEYVSTANIKILSKLLFSLLLASH